jgi:hypothetical protein
VSRARFVSTTLSGVVDEVGDGFVLLKGGMRLTLSSGLLPEVLQKGERVTFAVRTRGTDWIAEDVLMVE